MDVTYVVINDQLALHGLFDQNGNVLATLKASKGRALPGPTRHKLEGTRRDLMP